MRRSACLLTIVGLSFNTATAQDLFGPAKPEKKVGSSLQFYGAGGGATTPAAPQPEAYRRAETATGTTNYYSELFGKSEKTNSEESVEKEGRTKLRPATPQVNSLGERPVIQAGYENDLSLKQFNIQQVRSTGPAPTARPFPSADKPLSAPAERPAQPKLGKPSLTTPIDIEGLKLERNVELPSLEEKLPKGNVTFNQSNASTVSTLSAPSVMTPNDLSGPQTPSVTIEWKQQSAINVGQECFCDLSVKNSGQVDAQGVEVQAVFPQIVRLLDASPKPTQSESFLGWNFPQLKAGEEKIIRVKLVPLQKGNINAQANVRFTGSATSSFRVSEPLIAVTIDGPDQVMVGDSTPHTITIKNPGDGIASNVKIEAVIPEGLEHARGKRLLMEIGSLNPGETRNIRLAMIAVGGGDHKIQVQARADAGLLQNSVAAVTVIAPSLNASVTGPGLRFLGRQGRFTVKVANDGAAATSNVQMMHRIPDGFEFVSANRGVQYDKATRLLTWFVGRLEKGESSDLELTLLAKKMGEHKLLVRATSEHGSLSDAEFTTRVEGTSSLALEVIDLDDPVELGTEAIYEVRVKNEGSAPSKDVNLLCELSQGVQFVSAEGPTQHLAENEKVLFRTLPELGAGKTAIYRVRVSSTAAGNARFRARLASASVSEPLTADELTRFYGE